jgi:phosphoribosylglycinamide formyltransferase-1
MMAANANKYRIAVGVSGGGRSLKNLIERQRYSPYEVSYVFSSSQEAAALDIAKNAAIRADFFDFSSTVRAETGSRLYQTLQAQNIDLIVLAGFLKMMPMHAAWKNKIINIHPALLPKFGGKGMYGAKVHAAVLLAKEAFSGATVHFVNEQYDEGRMIAQVMVPVPPDDHVDSLSARVFAAECELLPWVIAQMAQGFAGDDHEPVRFGWQNGGLHR